MSKLVLIGIGGTGARIVETVLHLTASGNTPDTIYPVLIDQDLENKNVKNCIETLKIYDAISKKLNISVDNEIETANGTRINNDWFFKTRFKLPNREKMIVENNNAFYDNVLITLSENRAMSFKAAIDYDNMDSLYKKVLNSIYHSTHLSASLKEGYKKKAHMGSVIFRDMINKDLYAEQLKEENQTNEIKYLKNILRDLQDRNYNILICGSLFGGTGTSGIVEIAKYCQKRLLLDEFGAENLANLSLNRKKNQVNLNAILMLPYFEPGDDPKQVDTEFKPKVAAKNALKMCKTDFNELFHNVYLIGTDNTNIPTNDYEDGGEKQENPLHIFELISTTSVTKNEILNVDDEEQKSPISYNCYLVDLPNNDKGNINYSLLSFESDPNRNKTKVERFILINNIVNMLRTYEIKFGERTKNDPLNRTKWYNRDKENIFFNTVYKWAEKYQCWIEEMSGRPTSENQRQWTNFRFEESGVDSFIKIGFAFLSGIGKHGIKYDKLSSYLNEHVPNEKQVESIQDLACSIISYEKTLKENK